MGVGVRGCWREAGAGTGVGEGLWLHGVGSGADLLAAGLVGVRDWALWGCRAM